MNPFRFVLRYTVVPLVAVVCVVIWTAVPAAKEIDARQYASLSNAFTTLPPTLRRRIADSMKEGRLNDWNYQALVRESLTDGVVLDWPLSAADVTSERHRLAALVDSDQQDGVHRQ